MISIVAIHAQPDDPDAFTEYYSKVHIPLVQAIPGVINIRYGHFDADPDDQDAPFLICDTYFADRASLEVALASPEMEAAIADVPNFSSGGVTIRRAEVADYAPIATT